LAPQHRIISLLPSATEIVCSLGLKDRLVGRSHECDYPPGIEQLIVCSQPKYRSSGTSAEISREVSAILREALSIYRVDVEKIKALEPTHIITQSQCAVCAVSTDELRVALHECLHGDNIALIDLNPESLDHVLENILLVADILDVHREGKELVSKMKESFGDVQAKTRECSHQPRIAHIEWIEPIMVAGHWMMSLIDMAGGSNVFLDECTRWINFEDLVQRDPDKILIAPCGFSIQRSLKDMPFLEKRSGWNTLKAVREHEVYICEGSHYINRPGPRLVDSLEILTEIFHHDLFPAKHYQSGWIRFG